MHRLGLCLSPEARLKLNILAGKNETLLKTLEGKLFEFL